MVRLTQYIGDYEVPTDGITSLPLSKNAYDVEEPEVRLADFSKTIRIPASAETNKVFEHTFDVNISLQTFDPNLKTVYRLIGDGIMLLNGFAQLKAIEMTDGLTYYVIQAQGGIGALFDAVGDALVEDLDFSSLNHAWTIANIVASWTPTLGTGYVYPMIHQGNKGSQAEWWVQDFKPALFVKEYWDKIFTASGKTYSSTFLTSTRFKSLIVPQSSDVVRLSETTIVDKQFLVSRVTSAQTAIQPERMTSGASNLNAFIFNDDSTGDNYNTGGTSYNVATGRFTVGAGNAGFYTFKGYLLLDFDYTQSSAAETTNFNFLLSGATEVYIELAIVIERSGVEFIADTFRYDITDDMDGETITASYSSPSFSGIFTSSELELQASDIVDLRLGAIGIDGTYYAPLSGSSFDVNMATGSAWGAVLRNNFLLPGNTMPLNDTLPVNVKQKDFMASLIKRFNLFMEVDPTDTDSIVIEPLDDFLTNDTQDITSWVDRSREYRIEPLGALKAGRYIFLDQEDKDQENEMYQTRKPYTYGYHKKEIDNDFQTAEKKITGVFAPCPLWAAVRENDRIISSIAFPRDLGGFSEETAKPKLLYWGGTKTTRSPWWLRDSPTTTPTYRTSYPYAGHLDDPYNPDFDLSWGVPELLFYDYSGGGLADLLYTDKNCYNTYWRKYIEQISNKNSKVLEVFLFLDFARYSQLSFRKVYYIDGSEWRLLEVQDFDAINPKTTLCRFIKLAEVEAFTGEQVPIYGGKDGEFTEGGNYPEYGQTIVKGNGSSGFNDMNLIFGQTVQAGSKSIITGDAVKMGTGMTKGLISGSDSAELWHQKSAIINSPNKTLLRPYSGIFNRAEMEQAHDFAFTSAEFTAFNTAPIDLIQGIESDEFVEVVRAYGWMVTSAAITGGAQLTLRTKTTNSTVATLAGSFFGTSNNKAFFTITSPAPLDLGEGIEAYQASDMGGGSGTLFYIRIVYRIIKFAQ